MRAHMCGRHGKFQEKENKNSDYWIECFPFQKIVRPKLAKAINKRGMTYNLLYQPVLYFSRIQHDLHSEFA